MSLISQLRDEKDRLLVENIVLRAKLAKARKLVNEWSAGDMYSRPYGDDLQKAIAD